MNYLLVGVIGFIIGAVLTGLYARRIVLRAERMMADFADSLPRPKK